MPDTEPGDATKRFVGSGLELIGLPATESELAVIEAVDGIYRPLVDALIAAELDEVEPEPEADLSRAPLEPGPR